MVPRDRERVAVLEIAPSSKRRGPRPPTRSPAAGRGRRRRRRRRRRRAPSAPPRPPPHRRQHAAILPSFWCVAVKRSVTLPERAALGSSRARGTRSSSAAAAREDVPPQRNAEPSAQSTSPALRTPRRRTRAAASNGSALKSPQTTRPIFRGSRGSSPDVSPGAFAAARAYVSRAFCACRSSHRVCSARTCAAPGWKNRCALATTRARRLSASRIGSSVATSPTVEIFSSASRRCGCDATNAAVGPSSGIGPGRFRETTAASTTRHAAAFTKTQQPSRVSPVFSARGPAGAYPAARICGTQNAPYHLRSTSCSATISGEAIRMSCIARGSRARGSAAAAERYGYRDAQVCAYASASTLYVMIRVAEGSAEAVDASGPSATNCAMRFDAFGRARAAAVARAVANDAGAPQGALAARRHGSRRHRENAPEVRGSGRVHAPGDGHVARGDGAARGVIRAFPRQAEPLVLQVLVLVAVPRADRVRDERRPDGGVPEDSDGLQRRRVDPDAERTHAVHDQRPTAHPRVHVCRLRIQLGSGARLTKRRGRRRRRARARAVAVPLLPGRGLLPRLLDGRAQPRQRLARGLVRGSLQTLRTDRRGQRDFDLYAPSGVETRVRDAGRVGHAGGGAESAREIRSSDASTGGHQAEGRGGGDGGPTELERSSMRHRQPPRRAQHAPD